MRQPIFKKGLGNDDRISFIEIVVSRLSRRVHKVTTAMISPIPISKCVTGEDVDGDILKVMLFRGKIGKGIVVFNEKPKATIRIDVKILNGGVGFSTSYYIDTIRHVIALDMPTIDGSMITVSIHSTSDEYKITEVWLSMLWTPHISNVKIENRLIEILEEKAIDNVLEE